MTINDRIADAITRHGPDSPSGQAHTDRGAYLLAVADRVDHRRSARPDHPYQHAKYFRPTHLLDSPLPDDPATIPCNHQGAQRFHTSKAP